MRHCCCLIFTKFVSSHTYIQMRKWFTAHSWLHEFVELHAWILFESDFWLNSTSRARLCWLLNAYYRIINLYISLFLWWIIKCWFWSLFIFRPWSTIINCLSSLYSLSWYTFFNNSSIISSTIFQFFISDILWDQMYHRAHFSNRLPNLFLVFDIFATFFWNIFFFA